MEFARLIQSSPLVHDTDRARDTLEKLPAMYGPLRDLVAGVAGCSPYLSDLMVRDAPWLEAAVSQHPDRALDDVLAAPQPGAIKEVSQDLRTAKRRVALLAALADCGGVWPLHNVTGALSRLADRAVDVAFQTILAPELKRGKLPGQGPDDLQTCAGLVSLAMGKGGAFELNYSSDIDLICLFDDARFEDREVAEARMVFARVVRKSMALLSDHTEGGYVFRTDLRLRPDPSVTPVAMSMSAAERYYESVGRTWERAAFIKARPASGDIAAGQAFLNGIRPFIWRRHLDFATIEETQEMQAKIRSEKKTWDDASLEARNLKLGPGGIREIEFFVQTRQLIAGGRDTSLRVRGTCDGLAALAAANWMPSADAEALTAHYTRLRTWEHRAQMVRDAQTHHLPKDPEGWDRMARFLGYGDTQDFRADLKETLQSVPELTAPIMLSKDPDRPAKVVDARLDLIADRWSGFPALRTERARAIMARLLPDLLAGFDRAAHPEDALMQFERFLSRLPAGVQVFSLFEANPQLIDLMVDIASTSPVLAEYLSRHAQVLDAVIDGGFFSPWPDVATLTADLCNTMATDASDYEQRLDAARRWHKDWRFRIGVHHLRGLITATEAAAEYSDLAEAVLRGLWPVVVDQFAQKYGPPPGRGAVVIGMGSLGARALTSTSDLDLIVVYDAPDNASSDGARSLPARTYFARLTKALITALSAPMAEGTLYEVDMRLRPSGRQGPVATSWQAFRNYQQNDAWVWEHMALTRARVVAGNGDLGQDFETFRVHLLGQPADPGHVIKELCDMRYRLHTAKPATGAWDFNNGVGGRKDLGLIAAAGALIAGCTSRSPEEQLTNAPLAPEARNLVEAHVAFTEIQVITRLLIGDTTDLSSLGTGGRAMIERDFRKSDLTAVHADLHETHCRARYTVEALMSQISDKI